MTHVDLVALARTALLGSSGFTDIISNGVYHGRAWPGVAPPYAVITITSVFKEFVSNGATIEDYLLTVSCYAGESVAVVGDVQEAMRLALAGAFTGAVSVYPADDNLDLSELLLESKDVVVGRASWRIKIVGSL